MTKRMDARADQVKSNSLLHFELSLQLYTILYYSLSSVKYDVWCIFHSLLIPEFAFFLWILCSFSRSFFGTNDLSGIDDACRCSMLLGWLRRAHDCEEPGRHFRADRPSFMGLRVCGRLSRGLHSGQLVPGVDGRHHCCQPIILETSVLNKDNYTLKCACIYLQPFFSFFLFLAFFVIFWGVR